MTRAISGRSGASEAASRPRPPYGDHLHVQVDDALRHLRALLFGRRASRPTRARRARTRPPACEARGPRRRQASPRGARRCRRARSARCRVEWRRAPPWARYRPHSENRADRRKSLDDSYFPTHLDARRIAMSISVLATDGYKFSMAEAGWPLRRGDVLLHASAAAARRSCRSTRRRYRAVAPPRARRQSDYAYLAEHEYAMGDALQGRDARGRRGRRPRRAEGSVGSPARAHRHGDGPFGARVVARAAAPAGCTTAFRWRRSRCAIARRARARGAQSVTCEAQRDLVRETLDAVNEPAPPMIRVDAEAYATRVRARAAALVAAGEDGARVFEVGLRAASCIDAARRRARGVQARGHHAHEPRARRAARRA